MTEVNIFSNARMKDNGPGLVDTVMVTVGEQEVSLAELLHALAKATEALDDPTISRAIEIAAIAVVTGSTAKFIDYSTKYVLAVELALFESGTITEEQLSRPSKAIADVAKVASDLGVSRSEAMAYMLENFGLGDAGDMPF